MKTFTFTDEEMEILENWYYSAAGESASGCSVGKKSEYITGPYFDEHYARAKKTRDFIRRLGFSFHTGDEYCLRRVGLL